MAVTGKTRGIFPTDLVLRTMIVNGLNEMRLYPHLLDDAFGALLDDDETTNAYGAAQRDQAKTWFLNTDVPVRISELTDPPQGTSVTVSIENGQEDETTLADTHYQVTDAENLTWPVLAGPLSPDGYDPATGFITLPKSVRLVVVPGMIVVDRAGGEHPVLSSPPNPDQRVVGIAVGTAVDLTGMTIRGARPAQRVRLESLVEQESYQIGVHVHGEPTYMSFLWPVVKFVMLRGRETLERRGIERVVYSYTGNARNEGTDQDLIWSRILSVQARVRQTWTKAVGDTIYSVGLDAKATDGKAIVDLGPDFQAISFGG